MNHLDQLITRFASRWYITVHVLNEKLFRIEAIHDTSRQRLESTMQSIEAAARLMIEMIEQNEKSLEKGRLHLAGRTR